MSLVREPAPEEVLPGYSVEGLPRIAEEVDTHGLQVAERAAWSIVWLAVLTAGLNVWGFWWSSAVVTLLAPLMILGAICGLVATWVVRSPRTPVLQRLAFAGVLLSVLFPQAIAIHMRSSYTTDSAAFDQASARLLLHGHNPYTASLSSVGHLWSVPARFWTYTVDGGHVVHASYPAGSFLMYVPAMALGVNHMVVDWTDLVAWMLCVALFFVLLPVSLRWLSGLLALTPIFIGLFSSGGTDAAFLPFLVLAVWRWDRFSRPGTGVARWIGPVALGVACAIKQTPWFFVPILATGVVLEARLSGRPAMRPALRYLGIVVGVFSIVNLPFIVWQPSAWARGSLLPFFGGLIAQGQGLVTLATHGITGGADLTMLSVVSVLGYLAMLTAWIRWYPTLKRAWFLVLPVVFFLAPRSLASYLVDLVPVAVVAAVTVHNAPHVSPSPAEGPDASSHAADRTDRAGFSPRALAGILCALLAAMVLVGALALSSHTLGIKVDGVKTAKRGSDVAAVTLTVQNLTASTERPHFLVNPGSGEAGFWKLAGGRDVVLAPRATETFTLYAPISTTSPQHGAKWLVEAYTSSPDTISTSSLETWSGPR